MTTERGKRGCEKETERESATETEIEIDREKQRIIAEKDE